MPSDDFHKNMERKLESIQDALTFHNSMEKKLENIQDSLLHIDKRSSVGDSKDKIEYQYERARKILKNGLADEQDILQSCNITLEEIELLSGMANRKSI